MKVPITLVLLAAVGHVASRCTGDKCADAGPTTKRELLEGNYGQRTTLLNKFTTTKPTTRIEYADNLQRQLADTMIAEHIFGIRLRHIPKISDLLVDNGPPFDVALAHHLYAPVSVYNSRFQPLTSQWYYDRPIETSNRDIFSDSKISKLQKLSSEEDNHLKLKEHGPQQSQDQDHQFSYPKPDYQFKPDSAHGFSSQRLRSEGEPQNSRPSIPSFTQSPKPNYQSKQFLQQVNLGPVDSSVNYENQVNKDDKKYSKEQGELQKVEETGRPEPKIETSTPTQRYQYAHPNGAVSYANYIHNHPHSYFIQTDLQPQYEESSRYPQQPTEKELNNLYNIRATQPQTLKQYQGRNITPPENQQQHFYDPQNQVYSTHNIPETFIQRDQPKVNSEQLLSGPFAPTSPPQLKPQIYLSPIRQRLLIELQKEHDLQSTKLQQQNSLIPSSSAGLDQIYKLESTTRPGPPLIQLPRENTIRFPDQSSTQTSIGPLQVTPKPTSGSYKPYVPMWYAPPSIWAPELTITPKSRVPHDQIVQATTIVPETLKDSFKNEKLAPKPLDHNTNKLQLPQPTLPSLLVTPLKLQSLSPQPSEYNTPRTILNTTPKPEAPRSEPAYILTTPQHSVQIQQQNFHEIHSELKPQQPDERESKRLIHEGENNEHQSLEPQQQKTLTTPPSGSTKPDYEIEIAQHVDHSQLPKDLQPATTGQENTKTVEQKPQEVQPHPHNQAETQPLQSFGSFGEPHLNENVHLFDRHSPYLFPFLNPFQPGFQPHGITSAQEILQPQFSQSQNIPAFSPVQYFGNYAESIFRHPRAS